MRAAAVILAAVMIAGRAEPRTQTEAAAERDPARAADARLQWFQDARFGMFVHWGPVSLKGTEIGWSRGAQVPIDEYDRLYQRFDPSRFDALEWARIAKDAGMKYLVITAKHHDGFCLWDSKVTDYDIMATPFGRDVLRELADACRAEGLRFCAYYSLCDWHHPDYPLGSPGGRTQKGGNPDLKRYIAYVHAQLGELLDGYGPLGILWFDGEWEKPWTAADGKAVYDMLRERQPDIIVNNRVGKGRHGKAGTTLQDAANPGDYDTPEQRVGGFDRERPWETCMTICRQWAFKPDDELKPLAQCVRTLIRTAGGDGNLLLNVGPMPDGRIEPRQAARLREVGAWLARYGEAIYGTRGGPFMPGAWGASTCKGDRVYLCVFRWPLALPDPGVRILGARLLDGGEVSVDRTAEGELRIGVPPRARDEIATVIELTVEGPAFRIRPARVPSASKAFGMRAAASNVFRDDPTYGPDKAFDDDEQTRWATDAGTRSATLTVELEEPTEIGAARIVEGRWNRVRKYELQCRVGSDWRTLVAGERLGAEARLAFAPVTAREFRLRILDATEGPTIHELALYAPNRD